MGFRLGHHGTARTRAQRMMKVSKMTEKESNRPNCLRAFALDSIRPPKAMHMMTPADVMTPPVLYTPERHEAKVMGMMEHGAVLPLLEPGGCLPQLCLSQRDLLQRYLLLQLPPTTLPAPVLSPTVSCATVLFEG